MARGEAGPVEDERMVAAAMGGDETAFTTLTERYRPELRVHCYRILGSFDDSEDQVQETFLRAWRRRETFQGRSTLRAWLYRIATNACLDSIARRPPESRTAGEEDLPAAAITWLQPYPDDLLDEVTAYGPGPGDTAVARETIELAFMVAIQHLPPRQRAVLILRDVLGWPARDAAEALETSVASVNSALQRARPTLKRYLPADRMAWAPAAEPTEDERALLQRYMSAIEDADGAALATLLREDTMVSHQAGAGGHYAAEPAWYQGRETILKAWEPALYGRDAVRLRLVPARANRQPAVAVYGRMAGEDEYRPFSLTLLRFAGGAAVEVANFHPGLFPAFGLPRTL